MQYHSDNVSENIKEKLNLEPNKFLDDNMPTVHMEPPESDRVPETTEVTAGSYKHDEDDEITTPPPKFDPEPQ
jgi:hypothetical protein